MKKTLTVIIFLAIYLTVCEAKSPYKIMFNHDGTNTLTCKAPWRDGKEKFKDPAEIEAVMKGSFEELAGLGIDVVAFNPGNGAIPWWKSQMYSNHWKWFMERTGKKPSPWGRYVMEGGDLVELFVTTCHDNDMDAFITLRLKDEHGVTSMDNEWVSKFFYDRQDLRLDPRPDAVFGYRGLNWMYPEVVNERLGVIRELASNYDIDGFELDFMRFFPFFDLQQTSDAQRRDIMTDFISQTRKILDETAPDGKKRYLSLRVPNRIKEYKNIGIDLGYLDKHGIIDIVNVSPSYVTQVESDVRFIKAWAPNSTVFLEATHCSTRGPAPGWGMYGDDYPVKLTTPQKFYTLANLAYARGADGVSLFNFHYYRPRARVTEFMNEDLKFGEPPFEIIKNLRDTDWLKKQSQSYWIPAWWKTGYNGRQFQLPKTFVRETEHKLELDMQLPEQGVKQAKIRIQNSTGTPGLEWSMWVNDVPLEKSSDIESLFEDKWDGWKGTDLQYSAWDCPAEALKNGLNNIKIKLVKAPLSDQFSTDLIFVEVFVVAK
ncbi:MAG: hypothetical protein ACIAQZ_09165 [Sedimentisphaeraceae bacterium JB056]